jgi:hypothetical protein
VTFTNTIDKGSVPLSLTFFKKRILISHKNRMIHDIDYYYENLRIEDLYEKRDYILDEIDNMHFIVNFFILLIKNWTKVMYLTGRNEIIRELSGKSGEENERIGLRPYKYIIVKYFKIHELSFDNRQKYLRWLKYLKKLNEEAITIYQGLVDRISELDIIRDDHEKDVDIPSKPFSGKKISNNNNSRKIKLRSNRIKTNVNSSVYW